jgi:transaldolase
MTGPIARLRTAGVSLWLDDLSRERLRSGSLAALRDRGVSGVTTNPAIFAKAISASDAYDGQIRDLKLRQATVDQALRELTASDVRRACDVLRPAHEATEGLDGRVSIEVDPRIARDTGRTVAEARALWWLVDRPNLFAASFFVSRVDTEVDKRLDKAGTPQAAALRGKAAIANARFACQRYEETLATSRWRALEQAGARPQRPLWASTSVKDPAYDDTRYVVELVAPHVVNTMPEATLDAVADHGHIRGDTIRGSYSQAREILDALAAVGVSYDDVVAALETDAVRKFQGSWDELLASVATAMHAHRPDQETRP